MAGGRYEVIGVPGLPEVESGDDLSSLILRAAYAAAMPLRAFDILVVAQKVVSKAEGRTVRLSDIAPGAEALRLAAECNKDPRAVEVILSETKRVVRTAPGVLIVETHHGFICANAGVDASNVLGGDVVTLLPRDPDASARRLRESLVDVVRGPLGVIVSDSFNRPWREGSINVALGVAGMAPLTDQRGEEDQFGRVLRATIVSFADELASAAQLVMGEVRGTPVAIVRGVPFAQSDQGGKALLRPPEHDLFR